MPLSGVSERATGQDAVPAGALAQLRPQRIAVFGLGYVGSVSAACFAAIGHHVVGVDVNGRKVDQLASGVAPVLEPGLEEAIAEGLRESRLRATTDPAAAVADTDISLICVGTPSGAAGGLSTEALEQVCRQIGAALASSTRRHTVVVRSTVVPGTCQRVLIPILESASGLRAGADFGVCVNPEFLREGTGVADFREPAKTVVGELDERSGAVLADLYAGFPGTTFRIPLSVAELAKYVDNSFHALKVGFANEIGAISADLGIDSHEVMRIFRSDRKLNISEAYLTPGFSFGGSCLPKDLRALVHHARGAHLAVPILESVLASNEEHFGRTLDLIVRSGRRRVGILGLAFKSGTDELRESPYVELAERLIGKGYQVQIYDPAINPAELTGANREYIESHLPHLRELLRDSASEVLDESEVCVLASRDAGVVEAVSSAADGKMLIDLVRLPNSEQLQQRGGYFGVAW
jgi:GDP-mannose 6-dehydrogenase